MSSLQFLQAEFPEWEREEAQIRRELWQSFTFRRDCKASATINEIAAWPLPSLRCERLSASVGIIVALHRLLLPTGYVGYAVFCLNAV
jgi:hypothetical protein